MTLKAFDEITFIIKITAKIKINILILVVANARFADTYLEDQKYWSGMTLHDLSSPSQFFFLKKSKNNCHLKFSGNGMRWSIDILFINIRQLRAQKKNVPSAIERDVFCIFYILSILYRLIHCNLFTQIQIQLLADWLLLLSLPMIQYLWSIPLPGWLNCSFLVVLFNYSLTKSQNQVGKWCSRHPFSCGRKWRRSVENPFNKPAIEIDDSGIFLEMNECNSAIFKHVKVQTKTWIILRVRVEYLIGYLKSIQLAFETC